MLVLYDYFGGLSLEDHAALYLCVSGQETNQLLLIDLLINNTFSKLILSLNFKTKVFLNKGLVWEIWGWKFVILSAFFCKMTRQLMTI